ncbi:uncharacterized protein LOC131147593 [Malania oleifera]|uniref:uncharacterized protein LOC131147593 n=1 Tax=Malania oleifera TaxID=397392 RepID=UPI0025ADD4FE|nr:uncharacterized protein LOC131147593 [Malania oleifera]
MATHFSSFAAEMRALHREPPMLDPPKSNYRPPPSYDDTKDDNDLVQIRPARLEFPKFEGMDPIDWLFKVNHYFKFQQTPPNRKLFLASFHMVGKALVWYQDKEDSGLLTSWEAFVKALLARFGPQSYDDPMEALTKLKQTSSVEAYKEQFEFLSNRLRRLPEDYRLSCFIGGLKDEIRFYVKTLNPLTIPQAYGIAKLQEEHQWALKKSLFPKTHHQPATTTHSQPYNPANYPKQQPKPITTNQITKMTPNQLKEKRDKGLCFNCNAKWHPGHKCGGFKLFLLEGNELNVLNDQVHTLEEILNEGEEGVMKNHDELLADPNKGNTPKITFHAMVGSISPKTMRLVRKIKGEQVIQVRVANGQEVTSEGRCLNLPITFQGYVGKVDVYLLVLAGCDMVLGVQWLSTLGPILWDFTKMTMRFTWNDIPLVLHGLTSKNLLEEQLFYKKHPLERRGVILQLLDQAKEEEKGAEDDVISAVLTKFQRVFEEPEGLPPRRAQDHAIPLIEGAQPICVRPYCYPFFQKEEIEKIVRELLGLGTIRPSQSLFSSPI